MKPALIILALVGLIVAEKYPGIPDCAVSWIFT